MKYAISTSLLAIGIAGATFVADTSAQQQAQPQWGKLCSEVGESQVCNVRFNVVTGQGQLITGVSLITAKGKIKRRSFQVSVPSGRLIPAGVKMTIDKGKTNTLPYSVCLPDRCVAELALSDNLVKALKGGGTITLTSTNFRNQQNPVKVSLKGFTASFDGPPLKRDEAENRQKKIADELQKKAQETRDKLKAAQDKAKSGG